MRPDKVAAKAAGISKHFRRYAARYGTGLRAMLQSHKKYTAQGVLSLNHGRDRQIKKMGIPALPPRVVVEGVALAS